MKNLYATLRRGTGLALLAAGLLAGAGASAAVMPVFTVSPNLGGVLSNDGQPFQASAINGFSSNRIAHTGVGHNYTTDGYAIFTGFSLNSLPVSGTVSRVNFDYGLYAVFHQDLSCSGELSPGVNCVTTGMTFSLYADPGNDNTYNPATVAANASVNTESTLDILLASSSELISGIGGLDPLGGAYQNLNIGWTLTAAGASYFTSPNPFYNAAFTAFNNTSQGLSCDTVDCIGAKVVAIDSEAGILDFNAQAIPEPGVLALTGIGLLGMGILRRKSPAARAARTA
jgi:hypothetical protein|eukprot:gene29379-36423_t